jgi:hypothetical protein
MAYLNANFATNGVEYQRDPQSLLKCPSPGTPVPGVDDDRSLCPKRPSASTQAGAAIWEPLPW